MYFQTFDILTINNKNVKIGYEPLESYFNKLKIDPEFIAKRLQFGHVFNGKWELIDNKLYLLDVKCTNEQNHGINSKILFTEHPKIFADWFTGGLMTFEGKVIKNSYVQLFSVYETNTIMEFEKGVLINTQTMINEPIIYEEPEDDLPF